MKYGDVLDMVNEITNFDAEGREIEYQVYVDGELTFRTITRVSVTGNESFKRLLYNLPHW